MRINNLFVGIAMLLATTACTQGGYLGVDGDDIARTAERHEGSTDWAYDKKKDDFPAGTYKCNKFVYDVLKEAGATAPKKGRWPLQAADWADRNRTIRDWDYLGTNVTWRRGDVIAKARASANATGHCGIAVSRDEVMAAGTNNVSQGAHGLGDGAVRRYTGS